MALHTLNFWEIALGGTQICLCGFILLFLVRTRSKRRQVIGKAPVDETTRNFNSEFIVEAVRQQTEMAFNHILDTINKERHSLEDYFELRETPRAPATLRSITTDLNDTVSTHGPAELDTADSIYNEIENLADQGMSLTDISERLNVPQGEVDLVLRLKRLSAGSAGNKSSSSTP